MKNTVYAYPDVWVCLYDTYGCDEQHLEQECLDSSKMTEWGKPSAVFYGGGEHEQEVPVVVGLKVSTLASCFCPVHPEHVVCYIVSLLCQNEYTYINLYVYRMSQHGINCLLPLSAYKNVPVIYSECPPTHVGVVVCIMCPDGIASFYDRCCPKPYNNANLKDWPAKQHSCG